MGTLFVHCGLHKTGSSAFQEWLVAHEADLKDAGLAFPSALVGPSGNAANLALRVLTKPLDSLSPHETRTRQRFIDFCAEAEERDVLISAEDFETVFTTRVSEREIPQMLGSPARAEAALEDRASLIRAHMAQLRAVARAAGLERVVLAFLLRNVADKAVSGVAQRAKQLSMPSDKFTPLRGNRGFMPMAVCLDLLEQEGAHCRLGVVGQHSGGIVAQVLGLLGLRGRLAPEVSLDIGQVNASIGETGVLVALHLRRQLEDAGLADHPRLRSQLQALLIEACTGVEDRPYHGFDPAEAAQFARGQARLDAALSPWLSEAEIAHLGISRFTGPPSPLALADLTQAHRARAAVILQRLSAGLERAGLDLPFRPTLIEEDAA